MSTTPAPVAPVPDAGATRALCMATASGACDFKPQWINRRALGPNDVLIDMKVLAFITSEVNSEWVYE
jgi:hypothetical protein